MAKTEDKPLRSKLKIRRGKKTAADVAKLKPAEKDNATSK